VYDSCAAHAATFNGHGRAAQRLYSVRGVWTVTLLMVLTERPNRPLPGAVGARSPRRRRLMAAGR
jgi:hypothetical protein